MLRCIAVSRLPVAIIAIVALMIIIINNSDGFCSVSGDDIHLITGTARAILPKRKGACVARQPVTINLAKGEPALPAIPNEKNRSDKSGPFLSWSILLHPATSCQ